MESIKVNIKEEAKVANSGGLLSNKGEGSHEVAILAPWKSKTGSERTKNGSLGATSTLGWLNLSQFIVFLSSLSGNTVATTLLSPIEEKKGAKMVPTGEHEFKFDPDFYFTVELDANGSIINVSA